MSAASVGSALTAPAGLETVAHGDHLVIRPPEAVKERGYVQARRGDPTPDMVIAQAEKDLKETSAEFQGWMIIEATKLADARAQYHAEGDNPQALRELFQAAHTVRGNAGVFGYPLAGRVADSLAKLLDGGKRTEAPRMLIDQHVDAIRAIVREDARGADNRNARALTMALLEVSAKYMPAPPDSDQTTGAAA
ncbi:MAG: hypothetical protein BGP06_04445 [Rhizobiales bacterium 65-9]|nr:Hpt domain-containing protein [Hyphomicrobiales bacterium]OJY32452.1 MAG: hypothetical protein BGP06_04445 [Rhizobiales bacterium 65-9]